MEAVAIFLIMFGAHMNTLTNEGIDWTVVHVQVTGSMELAIKKGGCQKKMRSYELHCLSL